MGSIQNTVHYCSISRGNRILYAYGGGNHEIENLAALCLDKTPPFHKWYFETMAKRTYGFLMEEGYVYFMITDAGLGSPGVLQFLQRVRDEFKKLTKKGSRAGSLLGKNVVNIQEQLVPAIHRLITSLENASQNRNDWTAEIPVSDHMDVGLSPSPSNVNGQIEVATSTKAPLLGKSSKQEKKKAKDHVVTVRDVDLEEQRKSTDRGIKLDPSNLDSSSQTASGSSLSSQKDLGSSRIRSSSQSIKKRWWRQVRIVLAIDAAVCLILFVIWLWICKGIGCIR